VRFFTKAWSVVLAVLLVLPMLTACETVEGWADKVSRGGEPAQIDVTDNGDAPVGDRLDSAPGVRPVPSFPVPGDRDLKVMTSKLSGGSVEIYDLDNPNASMGGVAPVTPDYAGIPMATDPRVTVYPIDGYAAYPGEMRPDMPMQLAGQKEWPNSVLPIGNAGMMPAPDSFGNEERMGIEGGKLTSRAGSGVSNIYFPFGSANVDGADSSVLNDVAETAKFAPVARVSVEGHASPPTQSNDPVRAKILNLKESMNRASAVSQKLIEKGVPAEKIKTVGWGDTNSSGNEASRRRVDIYTAGP